MSYTGYLSPAPDNARRYKILITAAYAGLKVTDAPNFKPYVDNNSEEYCSTCHPLGRQPAIKTESGAPVFESNSIMRLLAREAKDNKTLYGTNNLEASQIDSWLDYTVTEIEPLLLPFIMSFFRGPPLTPEETSKAQDGLTEPLCGLDTWLGNKNFLVGERLSIADISVASALQMLLRTAPYSVGEAVSKKFPNAWRLYTNVYQEPTAAELLKAEGVTIGLSPKPQ